MTRKVKAAPKKPKGVKAIEFLESQVKAKQAKATKAAEIAAGATRKSDALKTRTKAGRGRKQLKGSAPLRSGSSIAPAPQLTGKGHPDGAFGSDYELYAKSKRQEGGGKFIHQIPDPAYHKPAHQTTTAIANALYNHTDAGKAARAKARGLAMGVVKNAGTAVSLAAGAAGGAVGGALGGLVGSVAGPEGTVAGAAIGAEYGTEMTHDVAKDQFDHLEKWIGDGLLESDRIISTQLHEDVDNWNQHNIAYQKQQEAKRARYATMPSHVPTTTQKVLDSRLDITPSGRHTVRTKTVGNLTRHREMGNGVSQITSTAHVRMPFH